MKSLLWVAMLASLIPATPCACGTGSDAPTASACATPAAPSDGARLQERRVEIGDDALIVTTGQLQVPELYADADADSEGGGRTIALAYVRVRRADTPTRHAHVILAGGPGDSGIEQVMAIVRRDGPDVLSLFDADIIGIDQRGTGRSLPGLVVDLRYDLPLGSPGSPAAWLPRMRGAVDRAVRDLRARGIRPDAYNTRESADDVDTLRHALGYESLTLWGRSYGTHLALAVQRRHPRQVKRMVLISPEGPGDTWKLPSEVDSVIATIGRRAGDPELPMRMRRVIARLAAKPVSVDVADPETGAPVSVALGGFDLQWLTAQALGDPRAIANLPAAYRAMAGGDYRDAARLALIARRRAGVRNAMTPLMDLASGATDARRARIDREAGDAVLGDAMNFPLRSLGEAWGATDLGDAYRQPPAGDVPVLMFVGDLDARTPVANATAIAAGMPNARIVVLENGTHAFDFFGNAALRSETARFLHGEPSETTRIALEPLPFPRPR